MIGMVVAVLFVAGCVSDNAPVNETVKEKIQNIESNIESKAAAIREEAKQTAAEKLRNAAEQIETESNKNNQNLLNIFLFSCMLIK